MRISGLSRTFALTISEIIINTPRKLLNVQVNVLGVRNGLVWADVRRHARVGISDSHGAICISDLGTYLDLILQNSSLKPT